MKRSLAGIAWILLLAARAAAQEDEFSRPHTRMYKEVAPAVVFVKGGGQVGSGVVIDKSGIVLTSPTACGVSTQTVTVRTRGHVEYSARVLGRVNEKELVVLKIDSEGPHPFVELGDSDSARVGQISYAFGDSFGSIQTDDQVAMSVGIVSGRYEISKERLPGAQYRGPVLEVSAAVNQNQDGGPVVDRTGRVVGLLSLNYDDSKFTGIAVPINVLKSDIERIVKRTGADVDVSPAGEPWVGIELDETDDGLVVQRVYAKSPAERSGVRKGDLVRRANGRKTLTTKTFAETLRPLRPGDALSLRVLREGREIDVDLKLGKKPVY